MCASGNAFVPLEVGRGLPVLFQRRASGGSALATMTSTAGAGGRRHASEVPGLAKDPGALLESSRSMVAQLESTSEDIRARPAGAAALLHARRHVGRWQDDVGLLQAHIIEQIRACEDLRESDTLKALTDDDPTERTRKAVNAAVARLKMDVRNLFHYLCEHVLRPVPSASAGEVAEARRRMNEREEALERQLAAFAIAEEGEAPCSVLEVLDMLSLRQLLFQEISDALIARKVSMDMAMGVSVDLAAAVGSNDAINKSSGEIQKFLRVVKEYQGLETMAKASIVGHDRAQLTAALHKVEAERDAVLRDLSAARGQVADLEAAIALYRSTEPARVQTAKLDEAMTRVRDLETQNEGLRSRNASLSRSNGVLEDRLHDLTSELRELKGRYGREASWYEPRLRALEESAKTTAAAFDRLSLDVQLLSNMYKGAMDDLLDREAKVDEALKERRSVSTRLGNEVKEVVALRQELERKDKIIVRVMAAREEAVEAYRKGREELEAARAAQHDAEARAQKAVETARNREDDHKLAMDQISALQLQGRGLRADLSSTKESLTLSEEEVSELHEEIEALNGRIAELGGDDRGKSQIEHLKGRLREQELHIKDLHEQLEDAKDTIKELREYLS